MPKRFIHHHGCGQGGYLHTTPYGVVLLARCRSCDAEREMDREALDKAYVGMKGLSDIAARLRCSSCGEKNGDLLTGYWATEP